MSDEALPAIEIEGFAFCCEFVMRDGQTIVSRAGRVVHVAQLLNALPDATRTALMLPHLPTVMVELRLASASISALTAENARLREELAHAREAERERCANTVNALQRWWAKNYSTESESVATVLDGVAERLRALKDEP